MKLYRKILQNIEVVGNSQFFMESPKFVKIWSCEKLHIRFSIFKPHKHQLLSVVT